MNRKKLDIDFLKEETWGAAFVREFELTIAANVLESMTTGNIIYEDVLLSRVGERCMPLDGGRVEIDLGTIDVPTNAKYGRALDSALAILDARPRGTYAVFRLKDKYDAYMSDGYGGRATRSGYKFRHSDVHAPDFSYEALYAQTLSMAVYLTRNRIENEIMAYSALIAAIAPGTIVKNVYVGGKTWNNVEFVEKRSGAYVGGGDMFIVRCRSRGCRPTDYQMGSDDMARIFDVQPSMPPQYVDPLSSERIRTLGEARKEAAQAAWDALDDDERASFGLLGTKAGFRRDGNILSRPVYDEQDTAKGPSGYFKVEFAPGTTDLVEAAVERPASPAPGF